jgi:hypothetical protein
MRFRVAWYLALCLVSLTLVSGAWAQGKFSVQFDNTPLSKVLEAFKRFDPNLQFSLAPNLGEIKVTASLVEVTVDSALQIVLGQAGLMSVKDNDVYQIREKPESKGARVDRPAPRFPAPVFVNRPTTPEAGGAAGAPGAAAPGAAPGGAEEEKRPLRVITVRFADPYDIAMMFGGDYIEGGGLYGSGGGGGGGGGSYGGGNTGGNTGGGSTRGSSGGSSRGSSGGSSRGSSGGSSRGSSGGSSRSY